ncbi:MAG: hypothetical protein ABEH43_11465, partial [Flavobacteriales bacterium]
TQLTEPKLFQKQAEYFENIGTKLKFGVHEQNNKEIDFVKEIKEAGFSNLGKFQLIDNSFYGEQLTCYIPENEKDDSFKKLYFK